MGMLFTPAPARALAASPRLLLMDEPLAALDEARKAELLPYFERLQRELALPILYVSHSLDEVARLAQHIVLMEAGKLLILHLTESFEPLYISVLSNFFEEAVPFLVIISVVKLFILTDIV